MQKLFTVNYSLSPYAKLRGPSLRFSALPVLTSFFTLTSWHGRVLRLPSAPLGSLFWLITSVKSLIVRDRHDKRLRFFLSTFSTVCLSLNRFFVVFFLYFTKHAEHGRFCFFQKCKVAIRIFLKIFLQIILASFTSICDD